MSHDVGGLVVDLAQAMYIGIRIYDHQAVSSISWSKPSTTTVQETTTQVLQLTLPAKPPMTGMPIWSTTHSDSSAFGSRVVTHISQSRPSRRAAVGGTGTPSWCLGGSLSDKQRRS